MDKNRLFNNISEVGHLLLKHGAEIYRVEESIERMSKAYGYKDVEVFAIPTYFNFTITLDDYSTWSTTKRSRQNRMHLDNIHALNNLVRHICINTPSNEEMEAEIERIKHTPLRMWLICLGYVMTTSFFAVFFGGGIKEFIIASMIGLIIYSHNNLMEKVAVNTMVSTLFASMLLTIFSLFAHDVGLIDNLQATIVGSLMILVPGMAITNSLRDIMGGEYISGITRMVEALLIAVSIAIGVGTIMMLWGGNF